MARSRKSLLAAIVAGVLAVVLAAWMWWPKAPEPTPRMQRLSDGVEAFYLTDSKLESAPRYPNPRELHVDGDFFIRVPEAVPLLKVRSRLLVLSVKGDSAFRITAFAREAGEQVEVLRGHITARKNYPSHYAVPDELEAGEMTMINRDIDLMEKETTDLPALRAWSDALVASVQKAESERGVP